MKKVISNNNAPSAPHILSQAVEANGFVFVSGMIGTDKDWNLVEGGVEAELHQAFKNIGEILRSAEVGLEHVVRVVLYVTDIKSASVVNEAYQTIFIDALPAREMVGVKELPLGAHIEVSVTAAR